MAVLTSFSPSLPFCFNFLKAADSFSDNPSKATVFPPFPYSPISLTVSKIALTDRSISAEEL